MYQEEVDVNECPLCGVECAESPGIQDEAVGLVLKERQAQDKKWGPDRTLRNSQWIKITLEELGEAAASDLDHESMNKTLAEIIQVSASALAWAEDMLRRWERMKEDTSKGGRETFCTDHEKHNCFCGFGYVLSGEVKGEKKELVFPERGYRPCANPSCNRLTVVEILYCCHGCKLAHMRHHDDESLVHSGLCDKNQKEWREEKDGDQGR